MIVVGGSFAGLAAAMYLARGRRIVRVVDAGAPRNRFAEHSHGFITHDGSPPGAILATARAQVAAYPTVRFTSGTATRAARAADGESFAVALENGESIEARRLVLAFGVSDELPGIPGLAARWGQSVIHCPYCHGYEFSDRRLGVLLLGERSLHQAQLVAEWGPTTLFTNGEGLDAEAASALAKRGVAIETEAVVALAGKGAALEAVELADGRVVSVDALYVSPRTRLNSGIATQLGCALDEGPVGPMIRTDGSRATTVAGVFAAGDITRGAHTVAFAVADGVQAGLAAHRSLLAAD